MRAHQQGTFSATQYPSTSQAFSTIGGNYGRHRLSFPTCQYPLHVPCMYPRFFVLVPWHKANTSFQLIIFASAAMLDCLLSIWCNGGRKGIELSASMSSPTSASSLGIPNHIGNSHLTANKLARAMSLVIAVACVENTLQTRTHTWNWRYVVTVIEQLLKSRWHMLRSCVQSSIENWLRIWYCEGADWTKNFDGRNSRPKHLVRLCPQQHLFHSSTLSTTARTGQMKAFLSPWMLLQLPNQIQKSQVKRQQPSSMPRIYLRQS